MSKFDALYYSLLSEQSVTASAHALTILNHINLVSKIVKRQDVNKRPEAINQIMRGVLEPDKLPTELKNVWFRS